MKIILLCLAFLITDKIKAQENIKNYLSKIKFERNKIFLFCRGTTSKLSLISNSFNSIDSNITHVGIGYLMGNKVIIFNVTNISGTTNAFKIEDLESFISPADISFLSIWKLEGSKFQFKKIKQTLIKFIDKKIYFDYSFLLNNGDSLYCSEFCANAINSAKNIIKPVKKYLDNDFYEKILNRKTIVYFPVDFFVNSRFFRKIFEYRY